MRRTLLIASVVFIVLFGALQVYLFSHRPTDPVELREKAGRLPALRLKELDGSAFALSTGKPLLLVYFNSTCDHCQRQINSLIAKRDLFSQASIVLMSSQTVEALRDFTRTIQLPTSSDLHIVRCEQDELSEKFGLLALPQIFIYDKAGNLVEIFAGETSPETLATTLK